MAAAVDRVLLLLCLLPPSLPPGISINDVSAVLSSAKELEELALGSTGLTGTLSCDMALPSLQVCVCVEGVGLMGWQGQHRADRCTLM